MTDEPKPIEITGILGGKWDEPLNPYGRISEIASRVGVKPKTDGKPSVVMTGSDGNNYDVFDVVAGVLDALARETILDAEKRGEEKIKTQLRRLGYELGDDALYVVSRHRIVNVD